MGVGGGQSRAARDGVLFLLSLDARQRPLLPDALSITPPPPALLNFYDWIHSVIQTYMTDTQNLHHPLMIRLSLLSVSICTVSSRPT